MDSIRRHCNFTEEEFHTIMNIIYDSIKNNIKDCNVDFGSNGVYSTYDKYLKFNQDSTAVALVYFNHLDRKNKKNFIRDSKKCYDEISEKILESCIKVEINFIRGDEYDIICLYNKKPKYNSDEV